MAMTGIAHAWRRTGLASIVVCSLLLAFLVAREAPLGSGSARAPVMLPASLAPVASAAIGANEARFAVVRHAGVLRSTGGGLTTSFTRAGVELRTWRGVARLSLAGLGYAGAIRPVPEVTPAASGNEVSYGLPTVREWYRNGPFGLEQGFTLARRPAGAARGPLTLAIGVRGSLTALRTSAGVVLSTADGRALLSYGELTARDATGRLLPAQIIVRPGRLLLRISDRNARYPLRIDPFIEQQKLLPSGGSTEASDDEFGYAVAISADGSTALIGGPADDSEIGAAWVFVDSGGTWTEQQKITAPTSGTDKELGKAEFGEAVALSENGDTALIGGGEDSSDAGAAWVYARTGTTWSEQQKLIAPATGSGEEIDGVAGLGFSVALSLDGNTALIGGDNDNENVGAAWVYTRTGTNWNYQQKLTAPTTGGGAQIGGASHFGWSVALSSSGTTALIGGESDDPVGGATYAGAAWVFTRAGGTWTYQQKLTAPKTIYQEIGGASFGWSVALSSDGNTALIGGIFDNDSAGAAWVFTRSGTTWAVQQKLTANDEASDPYEFGTSVALSADGNTALISGANQSGSPAAVWLFTRAGSTWSQQGSKLEPTDGSGIDDFGNGVALSSDGNTLLIGGLGAGWVYTNPPVVSNVSPPSGSAGGGTRVVITGTGLDGATAVSFGGVPAAAFTVVSPTQIDATAPLGPTAPFEVVDVVVTTAAGVSATGANDHFTYFATVPGAPSRVSAVAGNGQATVRFAAAPDDGSSITTYTVTSAPGGHHASGSASPITVRGLKNGIRYTFRVTATNAIGTGPASAGSNAVTPRFPPPTVARESITGVSRRKPKLAFTLIAARHAPALISIAITLPHGLGFSGSHHDVAIKGSNGKTVRLGVKLRHGVLTIKLKRASSKAQLTITSPELSASSSLASRVRHKRASKLEFTVGVTDSAHETSRLSFKLKPK